MLALLAHASNTLARAVITDRILVELFERTFLKNAYFAIIFQLRQVSGFLTRLKNTATTNHLSVCYSTLGVNYSPRHDWRQIQLSHFDLTTVSFRS